MIYIVLDRQILDPPQSQKSLVTKGLQSKSEFGNIVEKWVKSMLDKAFLDYLFLNISFSDLSL